ncbi:MAG: hypothetical protein KTR20_08300 [Cellvibrionaceae bacterium]|nr:hypothetical protein [Cellvibrionaceae bacterium]
MIKKIFKRHGIGLCVAGLASSLAVAAPGVLEDVPLNLGTRVQPNILLLIDDSTSMAWETLVSDDAQGDYGVHPNGSETSLTFIPTSDTHLLELCAGYNVLAYDPNVNYEPWSGVDNRGNAYADLSLTRARPNPYLSDWVVDISHHFYLVDRDTTPNQRFDRGECGPDFNGYDGASYSGSGGYTPYIMGASDSTTDPVGLLVDSGGVANNYNDNESHGFLIQPAGVSDITLTFIHLDLQTGGDTLRVYQGVDNTGSELVVGGLSGAGKPSPITITSGPMSLYIEMQTNDNTTAGGFVVSWNHSASGVSQPQILGGRDRVITPDECAQFPDHCVIVAEQTLAEQRNYANWYSYYRKREYVAKKALSDIISGSSARMGLATLHNNDEVGTIIQNIDNISPVDAEDTAAVNASAQAAINKRSLLENLFRVRAAEGTPLRRSLHEAGKYFEVGVSPAEAFFGLEVAHDTTETASADSPILREADGGSCQENFTLLFSDGYWNGPVPLNIGNTDEDDDTDDSVFDGGTFADDYVDTLADVAMHYYERDLARDLEDDVYAVDPHHANTIDPQQDPVVNTHQHMVTYSVAFGVNGTLAANPDEAGFTAWPEPVAGTSTAADDMRHAAWNGRGDFLSAGDAQALIRSLNTVISDIEDRAGHAASASFNATSIDTNALIFRSTYSSRGWSGDIEAYGVDNQGNIVYDTPLWSASERLSTQLNSSGFASRNIVTYNGRNAVPFAFPASYNSLLGDGADTQATTLSDRQLRDLLSNAPYSVDTDDAEEILANQAFGERIVDFFKGDDGSSDMRSRTGPLGAFIHSAPVFVGPPAAAYPNFIEGTLYPYRDFVSAHDARTPLLFVGGNDGMLHAFDARRGSEGGTEVFAYMPSAELREHDLHLLAEQDYFHKAYVDGHIATADVFVNDSWKTYLVGAMRSGGKGVYVLDITDPNHLRSADDSVANASRVVVAEFTHPDLGFTYGQPQIAKLNDGSWAAIFGNGYNNSGDATAKLFILLLDNLRDDDPENDYITLETDAGFMVNNNCFDARSDCNGLSTPTVLDLNGDAMVDRIYAGDLHGNLWAFDLSSVVASDWGVAHRDTGAAARPLFVACAETDSADCPKVDRQPITAKPSVRRHPYRRGVSTSPNLMVYFGTGQYIADNDTTDTRLQTFYGVWDAGSAHGDLRKTDLVAQQMTSTVSGRERMLSQHSVAYSIGTPSNFGWHIDLSEGGAAALDGERVVGDALLMGDVVFFAAITPSTNICDGGGESFIMAADANTGGLAAFQVFDVDGNNRFDDPIVGGVFSDNIIIDLDLLGGSGEGDNLIISADTGSETRKVNHSLARDPGRKAWSILR